MRSFFPPFWSDCSVNVMPLHSKLVCESHSVFVQIQTKEHTPTSLMKWSQQYRDILDTRCAEMASENPTSQKVKEIQLLRYFSAVWHLCEIFFLQATRVFVAPFLSQWQLDHYEILTQDSYQPQQSKEKKWDTLYKFAMYGQTEKVLELLLLHSRFSDLEWHPVYPKTQISERLVHGQFGSDKDDKLFHQLRLLLQTKPTFSGNTQHHSALVNNWKKEVERFLSSRSLSKEPEIKELLKILAGHQSVIESHANSWIERLCAQVNYSHPLMTLGEFRSFIEGKRKAI
eukprot:TRINITY_DN2337_c0_g1_i10.p1 TRINITY_DN2337_c0_g1~~TRINITY_DN2337_c0_g1_i10.p1  ORF type:complete len:286 (-),score=47.28 TRINITY_DN2337_c0_g1_i10:34-891(-)